MNTTEARKPKDYLKRIPIIPSNLLHIAKTGVINGSLLASLENAMQAYANQQSALESLKGDEALENKDEQIEEKAKEIERLWGVLNRIANCPTERINPDEYRITIPDNLMIFTPELLTPKQESDE